MTLLKVFELAHVQYSRKTIWVCKVQSSYSLQMVTRFPLKQYDTPFILPTFRSPTSNYLSLSLIRRLSQENSSGRPSSTSLRSLKRFQHSFPLLLQGSVEPRDYVALLLQPRSQLELDAAQVQLQRMLRGSGVALPATLRHASCVKTSHGILRVSSKLTSERSYDGVPITIIYSPR